MQLFRTNLILGAIAVLNPTTVLAHWDAWPWKNGPRTADGKIDTNAPCRDSSYRYD
jgi:hypothetical protein